MSRSQMDCAASYTSTVKRGFLPGFFRTAFATFAEPVSIAWAIFSAAGTYENARIVLQLQKRDLTVDPEDLEIPIAKLVVEE